MTEILHAIYLLYIFHKITFNITWCSAEQVSWVYFFISNYGDVEVGLECTQSSVINLSQSVIKVQSDTLMSDTSLRSTQSFYKAGTVSGSNNC